MTVVMTTEQICSELRGLNKQLLTEEPPEIHALRTGTLPNRAGSYGQYFTTWDFGNGILRGYSMNLYQTLRMATNPDLSVGDVMTVLRTWDPIYSEYLGYSGFETLAAYAERILESTFSDRGTLIDALSLFTGYVNRLTAWSHHFFPYHVGEHYRYASDGPAVADPSPISPDHRGERDPLRRVPISLRWEPLGMTVVAELSPDLNERLCADFLRALPFTVLQDHAMVTGESMYAWTPLVSVAPAPVTERICEAPVGRLRYTQATGNKLVVQYGHTTETLSVPVLGQVSAQDLGTLREVGKKVWESTFRTKEHIWLTVERL